MPSYAVAFTERQLAPLQTTAPDLVDLGEQVAAHLYENRWLVRGYSYEARIGSRRGAIKQAGRVITFVITQEN